MKIQDFEERKRQVEKDLSDMAASPAFTQPVRDRLRAACDAYADAIASLERMDKETSTIHPARTRIK